MKKFTKLLLGFMLILVLAVPVSLSACSIFADDKSSGNGGKDSSGGDTPAKQEYTITFDYGKAGSYFDSATATLVVNEDEAITSLPSVKLTYKNNFIGWFNTQTNNEIKVGDKISSNINVYAKFDVSKTKISGLFENGKLIYTWAELKEAFSDSIGDDYIANADNELHALYGELVIDSSILTIGASAFAGCNALTCVTIPNSVTSIGSLAFSGCTKIAEITYNAKITNPFASNSNVFQNVGQNTSGVTLTIGNSVTNIPGNLFYGVTNINGVSIGTDVTNIGAGAFAYCTGISSITIPSSVNTIGTDAFNGCTSLKTVVIDSATVANSTLSSSKLISYVDKVYVKTSITDVTTELCKQASSDRTNYDLYYNMTVKYPSFTWSGSTITRYTGLSGVVIIPNEATAISANAFRDKTGLTSIKIAANVANIGANAFNGCTNLTEVIIDSTTIAGSNQTESYLFNYAAKVYVKQSTVWADKTESYIKLTTSDKTGYDKYINPSKLNPDFVWDGTTITGYTGQGGSVIIPNEATAIAANAFKNKTAITSIKIGTGITQVGENAFDGCTNLATVTIDSSSVAGLATSDSDLLTYASDVYVNRSISNVGNYILNSFIKQSTTGAYDKYSSLSSLHPDYVWNGTTIVSYTGTASTVVIPSEAKAIGANAFKDNTTITSVTIPNSITVIGDQAFYGCVALEEIYYDANILTDFTSSSKIFYNAGIAGNGIAVTIGDSVQNIPAYLFYIRSGSAYRHNITDVTIGNRVTNIGKFAFYGCIGLTNITIPSSVKSIGDGAFWGCTGLTSITIPSSVTSIGSDAFGVCDSLTEINWNANMTLSDSVFSSYGKAEPGISAVIGNGVQSIPAYLFKYCSKLKSITIPNSVTSIGNSAFEYCTGLTSITIPDSVTSIGDEAFNGCTGLTSVTIGENVTSIGWSVFADCTGLTSITIPNSVTSIGPFAFSRCYNLIEVVNKSSLDIVTGSSNNGDVGYYASAVITKEADKGEFIASNGVIYYTNSHVANVGKVAIGPVDKNATTITIDNDCTTIQHGAFKDCTGLTSITIPSSVTSIGSAVFKGCSGLTSITIPSSVTSIGSSVFYGCRGLTSITIPSSVTSIRSSVFYDCRSLTSITIPDSVTSIGYEAFYGCTGLTSLSIPNSVTSIGDRAFWDCTGLTEITIPNSVTSIEDRAFCGCTGLAEITIPSGVTSMGNSVFQDCTGLKTIIWNANLETHLNMGSTIFYNAGTSETGISVIFGENVQSIPACLFWVNRSYAPKITNITIGNNVTSIEDHAFGFCAALTSITIPDGVTSISDYAFAATGLTNITIPSSVINISRFAFSNCENLTSVTFENKIGWYVTEYSTDTSGTNMDVENASTNAANLTSTYRNYYWKRNAS